MCDKREKRAGWRRWTAGSAAMLLIATAGTGGAFAACGLCATSITINSSLAACFLERFESYEEREGAAVAVDLDDCPRDRVVDVLASPTRTGPEPDTRFMVTTAQLRCLKERIEDKETHTLDPLAVIPLDDCQ